MVHMAPGEGPIAFVIDDIPLATPQVAYIHSGKR